MDTGGAIGVCSEGIRGSTVRKSGFGYEETIVKTYPELQPPDGSPLAWPLSFFPLPNHGFWAYRRVLRTSLTCVPAPMRSWGGDNKAC